MIKRLLRISSQPSMSPVLELCFIFLHSHTLAHLEKSWRICGAFLEHFSIQLDCRKKARETRKV